LVRDIAHRHSLFPLKVGVNLFGHKDIPGNITYCPGKLHPRLNEIVERIWPYVPIAGGESYSTGDYKVTAPSGINVRVDAGTGYAVKGSATNGTTFTVSKIASNGTWGYTSSIQCTNGKQSGWLSLENCSLVSTSSGDSARRSADGVPKYSTGNYKVTASSGINVRVDAGTGYSVKGSATNGTTFTVSKIASNGTWGYTSSIQCTNGKQSGWLSLENCSPVTTGSGGTARGSADGVPRYSTGNYMVTASSGINVRVDAGTGYSVKGSATNGTRFAVSKIASNGTWGYTSSIQCTNGKQSGWLSLENCSRV